MYSWIVIWTVRLKMVIPRRGRDYTLCVDLHYCTSIAGQIRNGANLLYVVRNVVDLIISAELQGIHVSYALNDFPLFVSL